MLESPIAALSVTDAAQTRRSIRQFLPVAVPREDLDAILTTVSLAPSAFNAQPWRFIVVENADLKAELAAAAYHQRQITSAPAIIVVYSDADELLQSVPDLVHPGLPDDQRARTVQSVTAMLSGMSEPDRASWAAQQANIALGFLLLAAEGAGYQTSAMGGFDAAAVRTVLGLPPRVRINALVAIGKGAEEGFPHHRLSLSRLVSYR